MSYPKTLTSRYDHMSSVVVMNAEQEAELPAHFRPADSNNIVGAGGQAGAGGISKEKDGDKSGNGGGDDVLLSPEFGAVVVEREKLERDRAEFAELIAKERKQLAEDQDLLEQERARLTASYKADKAKLDEDRHEFDEQRKLFENTKDANAKAEQKQSGKAKG